ncbi:FliA/WhiG family RNA polymerase sigma factor [Acidaminobacter sp. JC074]|uniref:sigma-70 family RNA polymerase sigma factor n=1 Tax=Acidaminobacter sp. JC074 TaxID=2530199 RepID=UPI001F0F912E|nr:FliA/WhiG family RNA polymerase sigma factor [Acidaminobacter sp. JC074]MCH4888748.1 FliA/WhiG family RNA polymerase sigma factor [Acidaminobacter sp. JC074]
MTNIELWKRYKDSGDLKAKEELIVSYVSLVKTISGRLYNTYNAHVEYDDLVGYGVLGLLDAIEKFDYKLGNKFETYANIRIRGAIVDQLRSMDWIPRSLRQKYKQLEKAVNKLQNIYGLDIRDEDLAKEMNMTPKQLSELMHEVSTFSIISLDEKITENSNVNIQEDTKAETPEGELMNVETKRLLKEMIEKLPEKEQRIIELYYYSELTYKEISKIMNISESRISQLHTKAITKMQAKIEDLME